VRLKSEGVEGKVQSKHFLHDFISKTEMNSSISHTQICAEV